MGVYTTSTSIYQMLPGLTSNTATTAIIDQHVLRAESLVNAKLARRFTVPFTTIPPLVSSLTEDIASYYAMRSLYTRDGQNENDWVKEHYDVALETLEEIRKGEMDIVNTAGSIVVESDASDKVSTTTPYSSVFELDADTEWSASQTRLDAVAEDRTNNA